MKCNIWEVLTAISAMFGASSIVIAAIALYYKERARSHEFFNSDSFLEERTKLLEWIDNPPKTISDADMKLALSVARHMDDFAFRIPIFVPMCCVLKDYDSPIGKAWLLTKFAVEAERNKVNWPTKWKRFEVLGKAAMAQLESEHRLPSIRYDNNTRAFVKI